MALTFGQSVASVFGTLAMVGGLWSLGEDGYASYQAGQIKTGVRAVPLAHACLKSPTSLLERAGKVVACPLAAGALVTQAVVSPFEGVHVPKLNF